MQQAIKNPEFAAKLALGYGELLDGIRPALQRVSLRLIGEGRQASIELRNSQTQEVFHWSIRKMRLVPDLARNDALVLAPRDHADARLVIRDRDAALALLQNCPQIQSLGRNPRAWPKIAALGAAALASVAAILLVLVPYMADTGAEHIPPEVEVALGEASYNHFTGLMGSTECKSAAGDAAVARMQTRIAGDLDLPYPLTIRVVDHPMINAFALPGGYVVLHSGLIEAAEAPEEVAAVMAHEIGHIVHRDSTRSVLRNMASYGVIGLVFGDMLGTGAAAGVTNQLITSSHSREAELAADEYAHTALARAGLPPSAMGDMFRRMQEEGLGEDLGMMRHLSTHPEMATRIANADAAEPGRGFGVPVLSAAEWQAMRDMCN